MERGVVSMAFSLGRPVLKVKANVSRDGPGQDYDNPNMADRMTDTEEKLAFIRRTKQAREARFDQQKPICIILGLEQGTYKQYESRTPLPHRFILKFCAAVGVEVEWLLTGEGKGPVAIPFPHKQKLKKRGRRPKVRVA